MQEDEFRRLIQDIIDEQQLDAKIAEELLRKILIALQERYKNIQRNL